LKKLLALVLAATLLLAAAVPAYAAESPRLAVFKIGDSNYWTQDADGHIAKIAMDAAPFLIRNPSRTLVPVRYLANALGVQDENIFWNQGRQQISLAGETLLQLWIGSLIIYEDGEMGFMDTYPRIKDGRTYLPARFVAEGLGYEVGWDAANQLVYCWPKGEPKPDIAAIVAELF